MQGFQESPPWTRQTRGHGDTEGTEVQSLLRMLRTREGFPISTIEKQPRLAHAQHGPNLRARPVSSLIQTSARHYYTSLSSPLAGAG